MNKLIQTAIVVLLTAFFSQALAQEKMDSYKKEINVLDYVLLTICNDEKNSDKSDAKENYGETLIPGHSIQVIGKCKMSGVKHGQFNFYDDKTLIAKTKFVNNIEIKTDCQSNPPDRKISLRECMNLYFK